VAHEEIVGSWWARAGALAALALAIGLIYWVPTRLGSAQDWPGFLGLLDHWAYYVPSAFYLDSSLQEGELPLWNPLLFAGTPFAANPNSFVFYPPHLLRGLLNFEPTPLTTHVGLVVVLALHLLVAGVGALLLARAHGLGIAASLVVAFAFLFSAGFTRRTTANMFVTTVSWLPFALLLLRRALVTSRPGARARAAVGTGLVFGLSLLAGSPHMALFTSLTLVGYGLVWRALNPVGSGWPAVRALPRQLTGDAVVGAAIFAVAALTAAVLLLPALEFAGLSGRGQVMRQVADRSYELRWLLGLFVSYTGDTRPDALWFDYRLAGLGTTLLALASLWHRNRRDVLLFWILFLVFLDCSLGPPLPFSRLQLWLAPYPLNDLSRAMLWACFPLAVLAGFGADAIAEQLGPGRRAGYLPLFALLGLPVLAELHRSVSPHPYLAVGDEVMIAPALILLAMLAPALLPQRMAHARLRRTVAGLIPLLLLLELALWSRHWLPHLVDWMGYRAGVEALVERNTVPVANRRTTSVRPNTNLYRLRPVLNGYDPLYVQAAHEVITGSHRYRATVQASAVWESGHRANLFLKRFLWLARQYAEGPLPEPGALFPAATTVFLLDPPADLPVSRVARQALPPSGVSTPELRLSLGAAEIQRLTHTGPEGTQILRLAEAGCGGYHGSLLGHLKSDVEVRIETAFREPGTRHVSRGKSLVLAPGDNQTRFELPLPPFASTAAFVSLVPSREDDTARLVELHIVCDRDDEDDRIQILWRRANSVGVELRELPGHRILTFLDADYPGWEARLDGRLVPIHRADDAFKAVAVPPGTHRVRFDFRSSRVRIGAAISAATGLLGLAGLVLTRRPSRGRPG